MNPGIESTIDELGWHEVPPAWERFIAEPMTYADTRLFFGDQGQGKSITAVACMEDDIHQYITHVITPDGEIIKARALTDREQLYLETPAKDGGLGIMYDHLKHMRVYNDDATKSKIISIPPTYSILTPVRIFANRIIYGTKYATFDLELMIEYINTPLMYNAWIVLSESVLVSRKDTNSYFGYFMGIFGAECRKRHLRMAIDSQYKRQINSIFHLYASTTAECSYDSDSAIVNLDVNKNSPVMESTWYWSYPYRRFFNTDEHMNIPQVKIERGLKAVGATKQ